MAWIVIRFVCYIWVGCAGIRWLSMGLVLAMDYEREIFRPLLSSYHIRKVCERKLVRALVTSPLTLLELILAILLMPMICRVHGVYYEREKQDADMLEDFT